MNADAILSAVALSLLCAVAAVALCLAPGAALAWLLARRDFRGKAVVEALTMLPLVVPPVATGYLLLLVLGRRGVLGPALEALGVRLAFTWAGAAVAQAVLALPMIVLTLRVAFESIEPELEEAARAVGASPWRVFWRVTLPLSWHGLVAGCLLGLARALGEFGATIIVAGNIEGRTRTLPLAIYTQMQRLGGETTAAGLVVVAIALSCLTLGLSRWIAGRRGWRGAVALREGRRRSKA